jgi:preprotein translocase subunit SecA
VYLNSLSGRGVHVVTVNDYLARRDADWMAQIYRFLGLSVGVIVHGLDDSERKANYSADVTYGTNNEFGFDYLRDNMKFSIEDYVQRELHYAIVDEVDSILIDEARTPLIISGPSEESVEKYYAIDRIIPRLNRGAVIQGDRPAEEREQIESQGDYTVDEKARTVTLTEQGVAHCERLLGIENLYDPSNIEVLHHVNQGLRAHALFRRDVDYVVKDGEVVIVDEFTGRLMPGRRWSDGLHQAVEAREDVKIEQENQTLATITFQNYFRMYKKLSGMTGTADTEAVEFKKIYKLDVLVVPTNLPMIRIDHADVVYRTEREKFHAAIEEIEDCHERGQPVLVGTISIEKSEQLSQLLKKRGVRHHVLNAKHHEQEAEIVAQAGRYKAVTISTNMAGRGTDIILGGNPEFLAAAEAGTRDAQDENYQESLRRFRETCAEEREKVLSAGGLHILGTERHESRRIDNQLRGRSGRQGDPGSSRFYLSLEDDLLRIFGADRIQNLMARLGMEEGVPIEHSLISRAIENAQKKVEAHNFEIRKHLIEYDDVMNKQREVIYSLRRQVLAGENLREEIEERVRELASDVALRYAARNRPAEDWDFKGLHDALFQQFNFRLPLTLGDVASLTPERLDELVSGAVMRVYAEKEERFGASILRYLEKVIMLQTIDSLWKDHLLNMDHLKEGIGLRGYGQRNPLQEYQKEGFEMFEQMMTAIDEDAVQKLFTVEVERQEDVERLEARRTPQRMTLSRGAEAAAQESAGTVRRSGAKVGRNDPCVCGSGKKYKKCCGK